MVSFVNETALFKGQWQFKQGRRPPDEYEQFVRETVRPIYDEMKERSKREELLKPQVVYGYFPAYSLGNDLIILQDDQKSERMRFTFPRQPSGKQLCLADFFAP
ncbi:MAG: vitamin B12 dependent-methionine synthase activation domain-containing protein, partial [Pyrinomonadaceae bacterium]